MSRNPASTLVRSARVPRVKVPLEVKVEDRCVSIGEETGEWIALKLHKRGWPDRLFLGPGNAHFFVEFKKPGKKNSGRRGEAKQAGVAARLRRLGHAVELIDNVIEFQVVFIQYNARAKEKK